MEAFNLLHIEDVEDDRILVREMLVAGLGHDLNFFYAENEEEALEVLEFGGVDLVLCDHDLPGFNAERARELVTESAPDTPFVIISGVMAEDMAIQQMLEGVNDYVSKSHLDRLVPVVQREIDGLVDRKSQERRQKATEDRLQLISQAVEASGDALFITDREGRAIYENAAFIELFGLTVERFNSQGGLQGLFAEKRAAEMADAVMNLGEAWKEELELADASGRTVKCDIRLDAVRDASGVTLGMVGVVRDRTQQHHLAHQVDYLTRRDSVTGLANRRQFEDAVHSVLAEADNDQIRHMVCLLDLDRFRVVNNTCGHNVGDILLGEVAALIRQTLKDRDVAARFSGDKFALLLSDRDEDQAVACVQDLMRRLRDFRFRWGGQVFDTTACVGLAPVDGNRGMGVEALARADEACHLAKEKGRNKLHVFSDGDRVMTQRMDQMRWVSRIREALDGDWFYLCGQEIRAIREPGGAKHFEVLVRMQDGEGNHWSPGQFIPAAEHFGLMGSVDKWVLEAAIDFMKSSADDDFRLSINLSAQSLSDGQLLAWLHESLEDPAIDPSRLVFEITETAAIADFDNAMHFIESVRQRGCRFALDDFGSGLSSFAYLKQLPVDYLKIDGSFVRDMERSAVDRSLVGAMHEMGRVLGIRTVAEFVDSEGKLEWLEKLGVDYAQGFLFGQPRPLEVALGKKHRAG